MMRVTDLKPGQYIENGGMAATFVTFTNHPLDRGMALVIWQLDSGEWSFDSLHPLQDVGGADPQKNTPEQCNHRLLQIFNRLPR
jgi:hypothetical protein